MTQTWSLEHIDFFMLLIAFLCLKKRIFKINFAFDTTYLETNEALKIPKNFDRDPRETKKRK